MMTPAQRTEYFESMTEAGFEVLEPGPRELLLDLDWMCHPVSRYTHNKNLAELKKRLARLKRYLKFRFSETITKAEIKKSRHHYHGRVTLSRPLSFFERQAYEMILGSDPVRAQHNLNHQSGPYAELLTTLPGESWTTIKWTDEDGK